MSAAPSLEEHSDVLVILLTAAAVIIQGLLIYIYNKQNKALEDKISGQGKRLAKLEIDFACLLTEHDMITRVGKHHRDDEIEETVHHRDGDE